MIGSIFRADRKSRLPAWQIALELLLILVVAVYAARPYFAADRSLILSGLEADWLTNSAYVTAQNVREFGRIPLWQPNIGVGEPTVENPIAFTFNPFSMLPSFFFGAELGIRYAFVLHVILAGVGGWAIGRLAGLTMPARLLLGVLMLAKGSMPEVGGQGYFQLGINQAYLPWAVAGALAIVRFPRSRAALGLLAVALTLLHLAGLIYYLLPALILAGGIAVFYAVKFSSSGKWGVLVDWALLRRFALAVVLMVALSAVTFIPILLSYDQVGGHPNEYPWSVYERPITVIAQLFLPEHHYPDLTWSENYALYTIPAWYAALLFVVLPPFWRVWSRPARPALTRRLLLFMLVVGVFFLFWGTGTNPLMRWAYENLPLIGQWRVLSRLLTVVSLALAVIVAIRFDSLWRALMLDRNGSLRIDRLRLTLGAALVTVSAVAATAPLSNFEKSAIIQQENSTVATCVRWLRTSYAGELGVTATSYRSLLPYLREQVGFNLRIMDFLPEGEDPTIFPYDLRATYARFMFPANQGEIDYWMQRGYQPLVGIESPVTPDGLPCFLENTEALPYAFAAPVSFLESYVPPEETLPSAQTRSLRASQVIELPHYDHRIDVIGLIVQPLSDEPVVVVLQEVAWRGWKVTLHGQPAPLESVGQLIGVTIPPGDTPRQILFQYDPPFFKIGAIITIVASGSVALWLLRLLNPISIPVPALSRTRLRMPDLRALAASTRIRLLVEMLAIVALALFASREYWTPDSSYIYASYEGEFLTSGAYFAANSLHEYGRIPLWNSFILRGVPALEDPYSFVFNPFSIVPSLLFGAEQGIRYSVALHFVLAGIGGWAIGRVLGFSLPARLFLAAMMTVKGSMPGALMHGQFQLGVAQAYLPWVIAASIAIVRYPKSRVPVVLLATTLALLLFAGNIYYILSACMTAAAIALIFCVRLKDRRLKIDLNIIRRFAIAAGLFVLLASVVFIPNAAHFNLLGAHPNERPGAHYEPPAVALSQLFTFETNIPSQLNSHHYVLMVVPVWFVAGLFILLPPFIKRWSRPPLPALNRRILIIGVVLTIFYLLWGTARNPIMTWAYANLPLIGQWRFQSRLLTLVALWVAVFIALRFDSLWRALVRWQNGTIRRRWIAGLVASGLVVAAGLAVREPLLSITDWGTVRKHDPYIMSCATWLRSQNPDGDLSIGVRDYYTVLPYTLNDIRFTHLSADYALIGMEPSLFPYDMRQTYPQYLFPADAAERAYWLERGYDFHYGSPTDHAGVPCLMSTSDALPYAFAASHTFLETYVPPPDPLPSRHTRWLTADQVIALPHFERFADVIGLMIQPLPNEQVVVVLQELAWPGWTVTIDDQPAPLESVGQLIGVTLEPGSEPRQILFRYDPPVFKIGALITLVTAVGMSLWLYRGRHPKNV